MKNKIICLLIVLVYNINLIGQILYPFNIEQAFIPIAKISSNNEHGLGMFILNVDSKEIYLISSLRIFSKDWVLDNKEFKDSIIQIEPYFSAIQDSLLLKHTKIDKFKSYEKFKFRIDLNKLQVENRLLYNDKFDICAIKFSNIDSSQGIVEVNKNYLLNPYYFRELRTSSNEDNAGLCISQIVNENIELGKLIGYEYLWMDENKYSRTRIHPNRFYCNTDIESFLCKPVFIKTKKNNGLEYLELFGIANKLNELYHVEIISNLIKENDQ